MLDQVDPDVSLEPEILRGLSEEQKTRLTELLDRYLCGLEQGQLVDVDKITAEHPDLADVFTQYLEKLNALYGVAGDWGQRQPGPQTLGEFTLLHELGRGGMGVVYEARQASLDRRVAIKLLSMSAGLDSLQLTRFRNEAQAAGSLQHPHIVPVYSVGSERGIHYYAMQLIDGMSMDAWVQQRRERDSLAARSTQPSQGQSGRLQNQTSPAEPDHDWRMVVEWGIQIAAALHSAHESGVIHRDVKPSNLMLDQQGKIWITDFGLARCSSDASLTRTGDVVGTIRYMSPEQAGGQSALVDGRTDVYSLAATIYEMLTLRPAHDGQDAAAILKQIDEQPLPSLRRLCEGIPRDLETVIAKAMSKSRDGRYQTAAEFADDLRRVLLGESTIARPPTIADRMVSFAAKHRQGVLTTVLVGLLGLVGFAISTALIAAEKQVSDDLRDRAEDGEKLAHGAVDRLGSQIAELLDPIPAAEPVRRHLLAEMLDYYQRFAATAGNDPQLRRDLAITYGKIGSLHSELGSSSEAIAALRTSERLYDQLAQERPDDTAAGLAWSTSQNNLALALQHSGQLEEAARYFADAINSQDRLWKQLHQASSPATAEGHEVTLRLATSLNNLGLLLADSGAVEEAETHYLRAIELLQPVDAPTGLPAHQDQLASVQANLSGLLSKRSPERAVRYARAALAIQTAALDTDRGNAKRVTQAIVTLNALGAAQMENRQHSAAIDTFERAVDMGLQLQQRWPDQPTYCRDLVIRFNHLGLALSKSGRLPEAQAAFQQAYAQGSTLSEVFVEDAETQSMLGGVVNNLGFLHQQLGDYSAARDAYDEAVRVQSQAVQYAPEVARYREYLQKHKQNLRRVKETP